MLMFAATPTVRYPASWRNWGRVRIAAGIAVATTRAAPSVSSSRRVSSSALMPFVTVWRVG